MEKVTEKLNENEMNDSSFSKKENKSENEQLGKKKIDLKKVAGNVGMVAAGVAAGIGGVMATEAFKEPDKPTDTEPQPPHVYPNLDPLSVQMAHGVTDDMSFNEAFATARHEGADEFEWHGNLYTTQLAGETAQSTIPHHDIPVEEVHTDVETDVLSITPAVSVDSETSTHDALSQSVVVDSVGDNSHEPDIMTAQQINQVHVDGIETHGAFPDNDGNLFATSPNSDDHHVTSYDEHSDYLVSTGHTNGDMVMGG